MISARSSSAPFGIALTLLALGLTPARAQVVGGVAERVGEALDNTGRSIRQGVQGAVTRTQARSGSMQVLDRVSSRLHWDKGLTGAALSVEVQPGGVTVLRGVVPNAKATRAGSSTWPARPSA